MALIDTSLLVAYLCPEPLHQRTVKLLAGTPQRLLTPLIQVECASALAIKLRTGQLDKPSAQSILHCLATLIRQGVFVVEELQASDFDQAYHWLSTFNTQLRTADALHLAWAGNRRQPLFTADRGLAQAAKKLGVEYRLIAAEH